MKALSAKKMWAIRCVVTNWRIRRRLPRITAYAEKLGLLGRAGNLLDWRVACIVNDCVHAEDISGDFNEAVKFARTCYAAWRQKTVILDSICPFIWFIIDENGEENRNIEAYYQPELACKTF